MANPSTSRSSHIRVALCATAALSLATIDWLEHLRVRSALAEVLVVVGCILPLVTTVAALGTLVAWSVTAARTRYVDHPAYVPGFVLAEGLVLYVAGGWLRGLYGLDPPSALFFLGAAMQLTALVTPLVALLLLGRSVRRWTQRRALK